MTVDIMSALDTVIKLGFDRVLTSGGCSSVMDGLPVITEMIAHVCIQSNFWYFYTPRNKVVGGGGYTGFTMSVRQ